MDYVNILESLGRGISSNIGFVTFIGAAIGGNPVIFLLGTLAGQGILPLWKIVLFSFLASIITELAWFIIGAHSKKLIPQKISKSKGMIHKIRDLFKRKIITALILSRIIYGTKIVSLVYAGRAGISKERFMLYNTPISFIWVVFLSLMGWLAGRGIYETSKYVQNLQMSFTIALTITIVFYIMFRLLQNRIEKEVH